MKLILCYFVFLSSVYGQEGYKKNVFDISNKVSVEVLYKKIDVSLFYRTVLVGSNRMRNVRTHKFPVRVIEYHAPQVFIDIYPTYKDETRELSEYLKRAREADHDSIIYEYLKKELEPNHFSSGYCLKYKISALKKWQGEYPYVDTEELYINRKDGETYYELQQYRLMWVDSCQYSIGVRSYAYKKCSFPRERRYIRRNFNRLVETIYVRREDELVDLKPVRK